MKTYTLYPSDLTFLWRDCPRCFYNSVKLGHKRPKSIMPGVFHNIDKAMKSFYLDKNLYEIDPCLPNAIFRTPDQWVESAPMVAKGLGIQLVIKGKMDGVLEYVDEKDDNGNTVWGAPDLKASAGNDESLQMYVLAMHAYTYALENPAQGAFSRSPIEHLGLLVFNPDKFTQKQEGKAFMGGALDWCEIEKDMASFRKWLGRIAIVLAQDTPPDSTQDCQYCTFAAGIPEAVETVAIDEPEEVLV